MKLNTNCNNGLFKNINFINYILYIFVILNLLIAESFSALSIRRRKSTLLKLFKTFVKSKEIYNNYDSPVSSIWNELIGISYRDLAGLGYIDKKNVDEQLAEINKGNNKDKSKISAIFRVLFEEQKWEHIGTFTGDNDTSEYCFTVIRNIQKGKVVISFSGTKSTSVLYDQFRNSDGVKYFRNNYSYKENVYIMKYFQDLYQKITNDLIELINKAKNEQISQYIFTGHSLGGAMASLSVFDLTISALIPKTNISPVLITYGQPRVGNYAFANELMKNVPIVYRIVNIYDAIPGVPACKTRKQNCYNEFLQEEIDRKFTNYNQKFQENLKNNLIIKDAFYPWHFGGLIYIKIGMSPLNCGIAEPKINDQCRLETSTEFDYHRFYFGYKISEICKSAIFKYEFNPNLEKSNGRRLKRSSSNKDDPSGPRKFQMQDGSKNEGIMSSIKNYGLRVSRYFGWINKRRKY